MKIVYMCSRYLPHFKGGTESLTHLLAKGMQDRGHTVRVACVESTESGEDSEIRGCDDVFDDVSVHRISYRWSAQNAPFKRLTANPKIEEYLEHWLERERPDCVHVMNCFRITSAALTAPRRLGIPLAMTLTEYWFLCPIGSLFNVAGQICPGAEQVQVEDCLTCFVGLGGTLKRIPLGRHLSPRPLAWILAMMDRGNVSRQWVPARFAGCTQGLEERQELLRELRKSVEVFLTLNDLEKQFYVEHGFDGNRIRTIIPTVAAVNPSAFQKSPRQGQLRVGFIGAMVRYKGIETLVDGFRLSGLGERASLHLWGDDQSDKDYRARLLRHMNGAANIHLHGRFDEGKLDEVFAGIDLLVIPSLTLETGPLVLFEAFARHTPSLCSNLGGMVQFVRHQENGFLFKPGDAADCARVLREIDADESLFEHVRERARLPQSYEEFLSEHESIYGQLTRAVVQRKGATR